MIRIQITEEKWQKELTNSTIVHQHCPNPKCPKATTEFFYPKYFGASECPSCKTSLIGGRLINSGYARRQFHEGEAVK